MEHQAADAMDESILNAQGKTVSAQIRGCGEGLRAAAPKVSGWARSRIREPARRQKDCVG